MLELVELGAASASVSRPSSRAASSSGSRWPGRSSTSPQVLLLDEPLGALDLKLRRQMQIELKRIQTEVGLTFVHVTHDQEEAMTMADTVAVMNEGRIEQMGSPEELYEAPATTFVANFLGQSNLVAGTVTRRRRGAGRGGGPRGPARAPAGPRARVDRAATSGSASARRRCYLRGTGEDSGDGVNTLRGGVVSDVSFVGVSTQYLVRMPWGQELTVFEQNTGARRPVPHRRPGRPALAPEHTFLLDAAQDADGRRPDRRTSERRAWPPARGPGGRRRRRPDAAAAARARGLPAAAARRAVAGAVLRRADGTLVATSLYDPSGSLELGLRR